VSKHLQRAFHAAIVAASALHCSEIEEGAGDASSDAKTDHVHFGVDAGADASDAAFEADAAYVWCEAGPPSLVITSVCDGLYALNHCDQTRSTRRDVTFFGHGLYPS
jgi:hypothetical protein